MEIQLQAFQLALSQDDIRKHLPANIIEEIKRKGINPYFQAYSILHEGVSKPRVIGEGAVSIAWPRSAVSSIKGIIQKGLQFFIGHNSDSSTTGRKSIGKVIADFQKEIKGKLHHIVIGHFPDKQTASEYDVCSIEAKVDMYNVDNITIAERIAKITGIALGKSSQDTPAFAGAIRLATLQAFEPEGDKEPKKKEGDSKMITFEEVKKAVKDMNIHPHQLYELANIEADFTFGQIVKGYKDLTQKVQTLEADVKAKEVEIARKAKEASLTGVQDKFKTLIPTGATEKQKEFYLKKFKPESMEDISEDSLKKFITEAEKEYQDFAKMFGASLSKDKPSDTGSDTNENVDEAEEQRLDRLASASFN